MRVVVLSLLLSACLQLPIERVGRPFPAFAVAEAVLREVLPVGRAVDVRVCEIPDQMGVIGLTLPGPLGSLVILVESGQDAPSRVRTLIHEWAHAMAWDGTVTGDHDETWGVAYSRAYRAVVEGWMP